jgi:hypothetical protein
MKKLLFLMLIVFYSSFSIAQMKGKIKHLNGTWRYEGGSGYEIWKSNGDELIGYGYRSTKFQDTILVEELKITSVNKRLYYTLKTRHQTPAGIVINEHRFLSKNRKSLHFDNIDNDNPRSVHYKFGTFNKNKLRIIMIFEGKSKPVILKLQRESQN